MELQKHLAEARASASVINQQLKELERSGIIYKKIFPVVPPRVEYYLTDIGKELIPLFQAMKDWGVKYAKKMACKTEGGLNKRAPQLECS